VEYPIVDKLLTGNDTQLYEQLVSAQGPFSVIYSEGQIELSKKVREN
jgi:hypothetical protein